MGVYLVPDVLCRFPLSCITSPRLGTQRTSLPHPPPPCWHSLPAGAADQALLAHVATCWLWLPGRIQKGILPKGPPRVTIRTLHFWPPLPTFHTLFPPPLSSRRPRFHACKSGWCPEWIWHLFSSSLCSVNIIFCPVSSVHPQRVGRELRLIGLFC